jgi:hypothetical protein
LETAKSASRAGSSTVETIAITSGEMFLPRLTALSSAARTLRVKASNSRFCSGGVSVCTSMRAFK